MGNPRGMPNTWADFPKRKDAQGRHLCRRCARPLDGGRTSWCGNDCLTTVLRLVEWKSIRRFVRRRDRWTCQLCWNPGREVDHIVEVADGGLSVPENLRVLCRKCHLAKTATSRKARAERKKVASSSPPAFW
jgi:5-methylcytosine-specific restriction endonuclease McrA